MAVVLGAALMLSGCTVWVDRFVPTPTPTETATPSPVPSPAVTISPDDPAPHLSEKQYLDTLDDGWRGLPPDDAILLDFGHQVCEALANGVPMSEVDVVDIGTKYTEWNNDLVVSLAPYTFCLGLAE